MTKTKILFVEITDEPIQQGRKGVSKSSNEPYTIPDKQNAYIHVGRPFPLPFQYSIPDKGSPLQPGYYLFAGDCVNVGKYGLEIDDRAMQLIPMGEAIKQLTLVQPKAEPDSAHAGKKS